MIATSMDGIFAIDHSNSVPILNRSARSFFKVATDERLQKEDLISMLPDGFVEKVHDGSDPVYLPETTITDNEGGSLPVRLVGNQLVIDKEFLGMAFFMQDLSELKQLELPVEVFVKDHPESVHGCEGRVKSFCAIPGQIDGVQDRHSILMVNLAGAVVSLQDDDRGCGRC